MPNINRVRNFEAKHQKPLRDILLDAHAKHGTITSMAEGLQLHRTTLNVWIMYAGLKLENGRLVDNPDSGFIWPKK